MDTNYIPQRLTEMVAWMTNFADYVATNWAALGLTTIDRDTIVAQASGMGAVHAAAQSADTRTPATVAAQTTARNASLAVFRLYSQIINNNLAVTDEQRAALQITIRATAKTPIAAPLTWPVLTVRAINPLQHVFLWRDSSAPSLNVRSKPFGALGAQLFQYIGVTPPSTPKLAVFVGLFTRLDIVVDLEAGDVGKTAYYYARWITARGLEGPLVGPVTATIAA